MGIAIVVGFVLFLVGTAVGGTNMYVWLLSEAGDAKNHHVHVHMSLDENGNLPITYVASIGLPKGLKITVNGHCAMSHMEVARIMAIPRDELQSARCSGCDQKFSEEPVDRSPPKTASPWVASGRLAAVIESVVYVMHRLGMKGIARRFDACEHVLAFEHREAELAKRFNALAAVANEWVPEEQYEDDMRAAFKHVRAGGKIVLLDKPTGDTLAS